MLSMACKSAVALFALIVCPLATAQSLGGGIPVYCYNCEQASKGAADAVVSTIGIESQRIIAALEASLKTQVAMDAQREAASGATEQKIRNAHAMDVAMGAKPKSACSQVGAASSRGMATSTAPRIRDRLAKNSSDRNRRARTLPEGEPRQEYSNREIIEHLDNADEPVVAGKVVLEDQPINPEDSEGLAKRRRDLEVLLNPFPVNTPSEKEVQRIKTNGTPREVAALAQSIAVQKRQEIGQYVHDEAFERNVQRLDPESVKFVIEAVSKYLSDEQKAELAGALSPNQLDELVATYRVRSDDWVAEAMTSESEFFYMREGLIVQAEVLNQLWELKQTMRDLLKLEAFKDVREVSQAGLTPN